MADTDEHSGRALGDFVLREQLASGGFGVVYRCFQPRLSREAVVKVLHQRLRRNELVLQRFMREALLASRLDHPYAVHVYAFNIEKDGLFWIAMEMVQGVTLNHWLSDRGPMRLDQFVPFFERVAEVVQAAHERGIVHRDLKPSNIMVTESGGKLSPKLLDFGIAKLLDDEVVITTTTSPVATHTYDADHTPQIRGATIPPSGRSQHRTPVGATVGSPPYMAPEQWTNARAVGPAADLYALAIVAYEAISGHRPFDAQALTDLAELHYEAPVPTLRNFSPALNRFFQRALAKRPEDRCRTALELASELRFAAGLGSDSQDLSRLDRDVRDAWLQDAPLSIANSIAELDEARNAHQACNAVQELTILLLRYLCVVALRTRSYRGTDHDDPELLDLLRAQHQHPLRVDERARLLRLLVRPSIEYRESHLVPELVDLVTPHRDGVDGVELLLHVYSYSGHAGSESTVRLRLGHLMPELSRALRKLSFLCEYKLILPWGGGAKRWNGLPGHHDSTSGIHCEDAVDDLVDLHPTLIGRQGRVCDLWPLMQAAAPRDDGAPEMFLFDHGDSLISAPAGVCRRDSIAHEWIVSRILIDLEAKARMREQVRTSARLWQDRARPNGLLWRGDALEELERWSRRPTAVALSEVETAFVEASRRAAHRVVRYRRLFAVLGIVVALCALQEYRLAEQEARAAEQLAKTTLLTAALEQGRAALLHGESAESQRHLAAAYKLGERSPGVMFMLSRALQPKIAELGRLQSDWGRMWSAGFSPDGKKIVTTDDRTARLWDAQTYQLLFSLPHAASVYSAVYTVDGAQLVTVAADAVRIWNASSGSQLAQLSQRSPDGATADYFRMALSQDGRTVAAIDSAGSFAHVWDVVSGLNIAELQNDGSAFPAISFSADGRWLATSGGNDVRVFDTTTWKRVLTIPGPRIRSISWDPSRPRLVTGSATGSASLWEIPIGARAQHLRQYGEAIGSVAFSPDGKLVAVGAEIWNAGTGALQTRVNGLRGKLLSIEFDASSTRVVAAGDSGSLVVADAISGMLIAVLEGPEKLVRLARFDQTSRRVVGASWDGTARVWDATAPYARWRSAPIADNCGVVGSRVPDQRFVAIGCPGHVTRVWDTARDLLLAELPAFTLASGDYADAYPAVSSGGDRAAIARANAVEIYELPSGQLLRTIDHPAPVTAVAFASFGNAIASGSTDGTVLISREHQHSVSIRTTHAGIDVVESLADGRVVAIDATRRMQIYELVPGDNTRVRVLAELEAPTRVGLLRPSQDGRRMITVPRYTGDTAPAVLWDLKGFRAIATLHGNIGQVFSARFVSSDRHILTTGNDAAVRLWDGMSGQLRGTFRANSRFFSDAVLSPDASMVIAGANDGLLRFWDVASGRHIWTLQVHASHVDGIHFEGDDIVTRGFSGDIARWTLPTPQATITSCNARAACALALR